MSTHPLWSPFEVPTPEEIEAARVPSTLPSREIEIVDSDARWPEWFVAVRQQIVDALGERALAIEHVGSTSVPGLAAKPVIDVDLTVADSADESRYLPDLEAAGFELRVREPEWQQHRMLSKEDPSVNLHVFPPGAPEPQRHLLFRDWLRTHPEDRVAYAEVKREVAARGFSDVMAYNNEKAGFIYDVYERVFADDSQHEHDPHPREAP